MGEGTPERTIPMRSMIIRATALSAAGLVAASMIAPASAATRHKRVAPAQTEQSADVVGLPVRPDWSPVPSAVYQSQNQCFTDEGYGRYTSCEQGGF